MVAPTFEGELQPSKPGLFLAPWTRTLVAPYCGFDLKGVNRRLELQLCARFVRPRGFVSLWSTARAMEHGLSPFGRANVHPRMARGMVPACRDNPPRASKEIHPKTTPDRLTEADLLGLIYGFFT